MNCRGNESDLDKAALVIVNNNLQGLSTVIRRYWNYCKLKMKYYYCLNIGIHV